MSVNGDSLSFLGKMSKVIQFKFRYKSGRSHEQKCPFTSIFIMTQFGKSGPFLYNLKKEKMA